MSNGKQQTLSIPQFPSVYKYVYNTTRMSTTITGTDIGEKYFPQVLIGQTLYNMKKRVSGIALQEDSGAIFLKLL